MADWETPEALERLKAVSSLTMEQIAREIIGINRTTLYKWCVKSESINQALTQKVDEEKRREVEAELLKNCFDRKMKVRTRKQALDRDGIVHDLEEEKEVFIPGDFRAQAYVLNNRAPGRWSQKPENHDDEAVIAGFIPVTDILDISPEATDE